MKVLIWPVNYDERQAGERIYDVAKFNGYDVKIAGDRSNPEDFMKVYYEYKPDAVFCLAIASNLKEYYSKIKKKSLLAFWYPDMRDEARDQWWEKQLKGCADVCFFSIGDTADNYQGVADHVFWVPQYFDINLDVIIPLKCTGVDEYDQDVIFITYALDERRKYFLDRLSKWCKVKVVTGGVHNQDMVDMYSRSKIAVNIQREKYLSDGRYVCSNRIYNAMGSGCFYLTYPINGIGEVFTPGIHMYQYIDDVESFCKSVIYFLTMDSLRERTAFLGQREVLNKHMIVNRIETYWNLMKGCM